MIETTHSLPKGKLIFFARERKGYNFYKNIGKNLLGSLYFFLFLSFFKGGWGEAYDEIYKILTFLSTWGFGWEKVGGKSDAFLRFEMDRHFGEF